jgi:glycosyltransferase involved in cell wall biosynthesis
MNTKRSDSPVSILLVSDTLFDTNGVSRFIRDMAEHARSCGADLTAVTASPIRPAGLPDNIVNLNPFITIRMPFYREQHLNIIPPVISLFRTIRSRRPGIIHISTPGPLGWSALAIAVVLRIPTAGTYHTDFPSFLEENSGSRRVRALTAWVMRRFYRRMTFTFSRSKRYIAAMHEEIGIPQERIVYLPPGTDTEKFSPSFRPESGFWERYGIEGDPLAILYVGRLNVEKNIPFMIERFRELRRNTRRPVALVLVGEGQYLESADAWRGEAIYCLGVRRGEELSQIYAASTLFLSASVTETLGQTVMEAQASGLAAVVSDRGGVTETVIDQHTGFTLPVGKPRQWTAALKRLVEDEPLRRRMGEAACERMQNASIRKSCEAFVKRHREFVEKGNGNRETGIGGRRT